MPAYTAKDLAESALPALVVGEYKTKSTAIQNSQFKRTLGYWSGFEAEVRKLVKKQEWPEEELVHYPDSHRGDAEYYEDEDDTESTFEDEIYACGDEQSVVGRFANNVGHVMGHVYTALGKPLRFSDWKGSPNSAAITQSQSMKIPDFAIWDPRSGQSTLLVIGEAKTPWKHSIKAAMTTEAKTRQYFGKMIIEHHDPLLTGL